MSALKTCVSGLSLCLHNSNAGTVKRPIPPKGAEAFFNITPESVMEKFKITKAKLKELVNG